MFAGIGGFRSGLARAGGFQCIGHCEIDKYANASYTAIYEPGKDTPATLALALLMAATMPISAASSLAATMRSAFSGSAWP